MAYFCSTVTRTSAGRHAGWGYAHWKALYSHICQLRLAWGWGPQFPSMWASPWPLSPWTSLGFVTTWWHHLPQPMSEGPEKRWRTRMKSQQFLWPTPKNGWCRFCRILLVKAVAKAHLDPKGEEIDSTFWWKTGKVWKGNVKEYN